MSLTRIGVGLGTLCAALALAAGPAGAAVAISVPASKNLGSVPSGSTSISAQLGAITVTATGLIAPSFTASVRATVFKTGSGSPGETIALNHVRYWSGPATSSNGVTVFPGQLTAANSVDLTSSRTAFSGTGVALSISATWNPTLIVNIPASAVSGTYSGTITHSVA